jgi:transposase InsO family protein
MATLTTELPAARRGIRELESELAIVRQAATFLGEGKPPPKRIYPVIERLFGFSVRRSVLPGLSRRSERSVTDWSTRSWRASGRPCRSSCWTVRSWKTRVELTNAIFDYIEILHNRQRRHSALGYRTPIEYEPSTDNRSGR